MAFACQRDSFQKQLESKVVSCESAVLETKVNGKKEKVSGYNVILTDTILFPEGGGQPDDHGTLDGQPVRKVFRSGQNAVHFLEHPVEVGKLVVTEVNWPRRFDHMQQHSGQHLITAFTETLYGYKTSSWWLGEKNCYIELETSAVSQEELKNIEKKVNEKIREAGEVTVKIYQPGEDIPDDVRRFKSGLPDDWRGPIRLIHMQGCDECLCCGTHVSNLSQLQAVKLMFVEKGKKNNVLMHFLCGDRLISYLSDCLNREDLLTKCLKNSPQEHVMLVEKLQKSAKTTQKSVQNLLKDLAELTIQNVKSQDPQPKYFILHRSDGTPDFMNAVSKGLPEVPLFLTIGDTDSNARFILQGDEGLIAEIGPKMCDVLEGKGSGKNGKFQGKIGKVKNLQKAEDILTAAVGGPVK